MRKIFVAIVAAGAVGAVWADATVQQYQDQTRFQEQPRASAYLSYGFGGNTHRSNAPASLHYGLRLDHDSRVRTSNGATLPPLLQLDHDNRGETLASANGIPFAGRNLRMNDDSGSSGGGSDSGWSFFDWGLLAVGVGGAGYLISQAVRGKDSPKVAPNSTGSSGGSSSSSSSGGLLGGLLLTGGSSGGSMDEDRDFDKQRWLDGGSGQMGDLGGH